MTTAKLFLTAIILATLASCKNPKSDIRDNFVFTLDKEGNNNYKWTELADTTSNQVYYIQLNFLNYPHDDYTGKNITDFLDSISDRSFILNGRQRQALLNLISDSSNFSGGDCGTFNLNAGFIIADKGKIKATISMGCGYNQWYFSPDNLNSRYGAFNNKGFKQMEVLLDNINLTTKK